jgi:uncharacterized protein
MNDNDSYNLDATPRMHPVLQNERILALDVMRGFALFGVLLAYALWNLGNPPEESYSQINIVLNTVLTALVDTKAYTLFAFLFGLGFSIQLQRAETRGLNIVPVYCRRLFGLLLIGLAHALLLRNGDILVPYAVMGLFLLVLRRASNKTLLIAGIIGVLYPYFARSAWDLTAIPFPQRPEADGLTYLAENFAWVRYWYSTSITTWPASLPMFFFGLYLGRRRVFESIAKQGRKLRLVLVVGLGIGALAYAVRMLLLMKWMNSSVEFGPRLSLGLLWGIHAWGLAAFYASALLLLLESRHGKQWLAPLAAVGRMALTNYLSQALIIIPLCIGLNLFGRVTPSLGLLLALAVWSIQVPASMWWLKHFRFGPAEWVWRCFTYGRLQSMGAGREPAAVSYVNLVPY